MASGLAEYWLWIARRALGSLAWLLLIGGLPPAEAAQARDLDWPALATELVERMALGEGETVLLVASPGDFDPLVALLREAVGEAGAEDLGALSVSSHQPEGWSTGFTEQAGSKSGAELQAFLGDVDVALMMPGASPSDAAYAALQDVLRQGRGRTIHFHWAGAFDLEENELEPTPRIDAFYQRAILETDYPGLSSHQERFVEAMRGHRVRVTTPAGTDLSFEIGDRPATLQNGDASAARAGRAENLIDREIEIPAGAVRVAPIEESVEGKIAFPPTTWGDRRVAGLVMTFEKGRVVSFEAETGRGAVEAELEEAGESGRSFREFVLGLNPLLAIPEDDPWMPYYGYGAGVVRLSLGDNSELRGKVSGGYVRWNFFTDATVRVGEEVWVESGELIR